MIKVWDYKKEYQNEKEESLAAVEAVFESGVLVFGPHIEEFEKNNSKLLSYHIPFHKKSW